MSEFKETGDIYVSKSGNDSNAGTSKALPKLTIAAGIAAASNGQKVVVGTGIYEENGLRISNKNIIGDGVVIMSGQAGQTCYSLVAVDTNFSIENFYFIGYTNNVIKTAPNTFGICRLADIVFIGGNVDVRNGGGSGSVQYDRNKFVNCGIVNIASGIDQNTADDNIFLNCNITNTGTNAATIIKSCYFNENCIINLSHIDSDLVNCNINTSSLTLNGANVTVNDLTNCFDLDPLFSGNPFRLEFLVRPDSPMIASGFNAKNVGNVKTGYLLNSDSLEFGLSPQSAGNTRFSNGVLEITGLNNTGTRESKEIDLGQLVKSPTIRFNGVTDFVNNVPDNNNALTNPNALVVEIQYAGIDKVYSDWEFVRYNEKLIKDNTDKHSGDTGFLWTSPVDLSFRYIKFRVTLRNNYNES
ncbi:MAG: hypothetical protein AAFY41_04660 [Bacteroidota bacterium]